MNAQPALLQRYQKHTPVRGTQQFTSILTLGSRTLIVCCICKLNYVIALQHL